MAKCSHSCVRSVQEVQARCGAGKLNCRPDGGSTRTRSHPLMVRLGVWVPSSGGKDTGFERTGQNLGTLKGV